MSTQICRGFTDEQWRSLSERLTLDGNVRGYDGAARADWDYAIHVFERRIEERFFSCIKALEQSDTKSDVEIAHNATSDRATISLDEPYAVVPGFAIVGLCCLLVETLASFAETDRDVPPQPTGPCQFPNGECIRPQSPGGKRIREFLRRPSFGEAFIEDEVGKRFVRGVRDGIFHEAETRGWLIRRDEPSSVIVGFEDGQYILNRTAFVVALRREFAGYLSDLRDAKGSTLRRRFLKKMNDIVKASAGTRSGKAVGK